MIFSRFHSPRRQRGAIAIMVAVSMVMLLAVVGLAVDAGLAYMVKARLNAAVDSAALAGARAVTVGSNQAAQTASAQANAAQFFAANIPANYLLSKPALLSTNVTFNGGTATIDVRAEAPMPVSIMQVLGFKSLDPVAYAQTIRKDLDMMLVVDTSGSLSASATAVRAAATTFLNQFNVTQDRVGLVHFASGVQIDNPIPLVTRGFDRTTMLANVAALNFGGTTSSVEGMWNARNQLNAILPVNRSSMRVIVFFSDGAPTGFTGYFTFADQSASKGCPATTRGALDATLAGLYVPTVSASTKTTTGCTVSSSTITTMIPNLPAYYNAYDNLNLFPIVTATTAAHPVASSLTSSTVAARYIDRASRNLTEAVASKARDEGAIIFTLGLGASLLAKSVNDSTNTDTGQDILKCLANVTDSLARCYNPAQPVGMYCYAATTADLTPCFSRLASAILRISK